MANNAQSLVNYLEKIVMATNSSGLTWIHATYLPRAKGKRKKRKAESKN